MKKILFIFLISALFLSACKKNETDQTQAELTAAKLIKLFGSSSGSLPSGNAIHIVNESGKSSTTSSSFSISSDGFITIGDSFNSCSYNLSYLIMYQVYISNSNVIYFLYFSGI
jgi:hypothetical protein